ncbi:phytoene desaturase family protein [Aneurinibacillus tyrosinisolvens]|uniref:phytoene desaturase family protein n=1 Tax=Aneurinibacillus tyrosinisolvens TaxID=1443435 RepID=UPI00063F2738|nr:NAD(P)/FAD-dependent oxidoreductase [Aneurinibacillus tyrosinisolvens]
MENHHYDVIVVGSGIGGLTAAVDLASHGKKVTVLEQHYMFGGACTTYTRKGGFKFDAGVESISGLGKQGPVRHFLQRHGMMENITWLKNTYEFRYDDEIFEIPHKYEEWRDRLIVQYPHEAYGIKQFFTTCKAAYEEKYTVFAPDRVIPRIPKTKGEMMEYPAKNPNYFRWMRSTWGEFLQAFIQDSVLIQNLSMLTGYVGDLGLKTPTSTMLSIMGYFIEGGYRPQGGSGILADQLVKKLRSYGSEARINTHADSIMIEENQVKGVRTNKGDFFAPVVISNTDPRVTYEKLIGLDCLSAAYQEKVRQLEPSMSLISWSAALQTPFITERLISHKFSKPVEFPANGLTVDGIAYHSAARLDESLAPNGCGTVVIMFKASPSASYYQQMGEQQYLQRKQEIDMKCREFLAAIDPIAEKSILFSEVATPKTVERYMKTYEGSIYSTKMDKENGFPSLQSPIGGLYLAGAGVGEGPGIEAVVITGATVAELIRSNEFTCI